MKMVVSTVGLEGPAPISISGDPVFDVMTPAFQGFRKGEVGFSTMNDGGREDKRRNLESGGGEFGLQGPVSFFRRTLDSFYLAGGPLEQVVRVV
jgi:hypothetical protein